MNPGCAAIPENHREIQIANVSFPLTVTPGLQLKHPTKLSEPVAYEFSHLEMSERTHNGLTDNLLNKTKKDTHPHYNYRTAGQDFYSQPKMQILTE